MTAERLNDTNRSTKEETIKYMLEKISKPHKYKSYAYKSKLNCNYCSCDEISKKLVKTHTDYISLPLSHLCNQSVIKGHFPE